VFSSDGVPRAVFGEGLLRLAGLGGGGGESVDLMPVNDVGSLLLLVVCSSCACVDQLMSVKSIKSCSGDAVRGISDAARVVVNAFCRGGRAGNTALVPLPFAVL
jgi:hypothetical protein